MKVFKNPIALADGIKKHSGSLSLPNLRNYFDTEIDPPCEIELGDVIKLGLFFFFFFFFFLCCGLWALCKKTQGLKV